MITEEIQIEGQANNAIFSTPSNEWERLIALNELELDYSDLDQSFADLTKLAAKIAGTSISMINLIDTFTQWSVASFGLNIKQSPRENSVCQYTILEQNSGGMEVPDLSADDRFKDLAYVKSDPHLRYYFGIPLKIKNDLSIGTLCVIHDDYKDISADKKEMLAIIAGEIVNRIKIRYALSTLTQQLQECTAIKNNVAHDIRGPIGGIIGLAEIIQMQGLDNNLEEVLSYVGLIQKSGKSVLELADEILSSHGDSVQPKEHEFTLATLEGKLLDLFGPQALAKHVKLKFHTSATHSAVPFGKTGILQILGNLISNSIKFTPGGGQVDVLMDIDVVDRQRRLQLKVKDNGIGMQHGKIEEILDGKANSTKGTLGEKGFGFGLKLVSQLVSKLKGQMSLRSEPGKGVELELMLPIS